jgi:thiamine pyrophosphokinase
MHIRFGSTNYALLLLDGEPPSDEICRRIATNASFIVAADGAARTARKLGLTVDVIIGDLDSIDQDSKEHYHNSELIKISDQYSNDFEKALKYLIETNRTVALIILGLHGKRIDHTLANFSVLARFRDSFENVICIDDFQLHSLLTENHHSIVIDEPKQTIVSLTPLPVASSVKTSGLFYPLDNATMSFGEQEGMHNIIVSAEGATVTISSGHLLVSIQHHGKI